MAVTRIHILNMIFLAVLGVVILLLSLMTANSLTTTNDKLPIEGWKFYLGREILPDNILYPLLMVKDRLQHDQAEPIDQVTLKLEYAEKRYQTSQELVARDQFPLAISTLTKSQKYMISAGYQILSLEQINQDQLQSIRDALDHSIYRIDAFSANYPGQDLGALNQLREDSRVLLSKIDEHLTKM